MTDAVVLTLPNEPRFLVLVRLALSGLASQHDLPYDRMDDLQLAVEAVLAEERAEGLETTLRIEPIEEGVGVSIRVGDGHEIAAAGDGGAPLERMLSLLVDSVTTTDGDDGGRWLRLEQGNRRR
jgi:hypothetical protein